MDRRYVGIDLHRRRSVIYAMDAQGDRLFCERIANESLRLLEIVSQAGASDHAAMESAVISAHRNPASSRAIAAATTERTFLRAAMPAPTCGRCLVGPCGFDELGAEVPVAGVGDIAAMFAEPGRVFRGDQTSERHE